MSNTSWLCLIQYLVLLHFGRYLFGVEFSQACTRVETVGHSRPTYYFEILFMGFKGYKGLLFVRLGRNRIALLVSFRLTPHIGICFRGLALFMKGSLYIAILNKLYNKFYSEYVCVI